MDTKDSMDQVFIKKVTELLEVNLGNEQFGVKELVSEMGMSRSKLHRKLQIKLSIYCNRSIMYCLYSFSIFVSLNYYKPLNS